MAEKKFLKGSEEWMMFRDYWDLCQKIWIPEDNDEYWELVIKETNDFYEKYKELPLTKAIVMCLIESLEKRSKELKKNEINISG